MGLLIKKRVSLEFLGKEYKESYIEFKAIPLKDFEKLTTEVEAIGEDGIKSIKFISDKLKEYFISGKSPEGDLSKEDLDELDQESVVKCFEVLTGQNINEEKDFLEPDSNKPSSTTADPPSNS